MATTPTAGNFRFDGLQVFLTYSQAPPAWTKESVLGRLQAIQEVARYSVGHEHHQDGGDHYHVYIKWASRLQTTDTRRFDIDGIHPNIATIGRAKADICRVVRYTRKDGDYHSNIPDDDLAGTARQSRDSTYTHAMEAVDAGTFLQRLVKAAPRDYVLFGQAVRKHAELHYTAGPSDPVRPLTSFNIPGELLEWRAEQFTTPRPARGKSLFLVGPTRLGKTELARSFGKHFYMGNMFNLDKYNDEADYAVFDDISKLNYLKYKGFLHCQLEFEATDKYRHKKIIPWRGRPSIFCLNVEPFRQFKREMDIDAWRDLEENVLIYFVADRLYTDTTE